MHIKRLFEYTNQKIIARYNKDYPNNCLSGEAALKELLKFFWLSHIYKLDHLQNPNDPNLAFKCVMHKEMHEIDDMWHTFLLFSKDYMDFCYHYFDEYLHHVPNTDLVPTMAISYETEFTKYLSYIQKSLGANTLRVWFAELLQDA